MAAAVKIHDLRCYARQWLQPVLGHELGRSGPNGQGVLLLWQEGRLPEGMELDHNDDPMSSDDEEEEGTPRPAKRICLPLVVGTLSGAQQLGSRHVSEHLAWGPSLLPRKHDDQLLMRSIIFCSCSSFGVQWQAWGASTTTTQPSTTRAACSLRAMRPPAQWPHLLPA